MNRNRFLALFALLAAAVPRLHAGLFDAWNYTADLTFSGYAGTEALSAFPALVCVTNFPGFDYSQVARADGGDLRFTDATGTVELPFEIEAWNPSGASFVWVQVPEITGQETAIRAYWGRAAATMPAYTSDGTTWTNGYVAVYHLNEADGTVYDSTTNHNDSSSVVGDVLRGQEGAVGPAYQFDGSGDYISIPDSATLDGMTKLTLEVWELDQDTSNKTATRTFLSKRESSSNGKRSYYFYRQNNRDLYAYINDGGGQFNGSAPAASGWHHAAFTFDAAPSSNEMKVYADGTYKAQKGNGAASVANRDDPLLIGRMGGKTDNDWKGLLDEIRISNVARSKDWLKASWQTVAANTDFCAYGETRNLGLPWPTTDAATDVTANGATLVGTLALPHSATTVTVFWGRTDGGTDPAAWEYSHAFDAYSGAEAASFTQSVALPVADSTWYFRHCGTNAEGTNWSPESAAFINGGVSVQATVPTTAEEGSAPAVFTVSRPVGTEALDTIVAYSLGGTATAGEDYAALSGTVAIPAGELTATVDVAPVLDFAQEGDETVVLTLLPGLYALGSAAQASATILDYVPPADGATNVWIGSGNASVAANWSLGHAPTASEHVLLTGFSIADLTWNSGVDGLTGHVASWTQDADYTGTVYLNAPFDATDPVLVVDGDAVLAGGAWSHTGAVDSENFKLYARVEGDMTVSATIDASKRGFKSQKGPGYTKGGSSYGGEGATTGSWTKTYGSVFEPLRWGSGGGKSSYTGGGVVQLEVAGTLTVTGSVRANGGGVSNNDGAGSGGSVLLRVGTLLGNGVLSADGGQDGWSGNGGGGRIAIYLMDADAVPSQFGGSVTVAGYGNQKYNQGSYESGCGTVYWQTAQDPDGGGTVVVNNPLLQNRTTTDWRSCQLPSALGPVEDYSKSNWILQENAHLKLTADVTVNSLVIEASDTASAAAQLNLNGQTLRTMGLTILGTEYPAGTYLPANLPEGRVFDNAAEPVGQIIVLAQQTVTDAPTVRTDAAFAISTTGASLVGTVEESSSAFTVAVFWGRTDAGIDPGAWEHSHVFEPYDGPVPVSFTNTVSGLEPDAVWYVRHCAFNAAGTNWTESAAAFINGAVSVEATVASAREEGNDVAVFTVSRPSGTEALDTVVPYSVGGTATPGVD